MPKPISADQLSRVLKTPAKPAAKVVVARVAKAKVVYNPDVYDSVLEQMFNRRWDADEQFPPFSREIKSALHCLLAPPEFEYVPVLIDILETTKSEFLRSQAIGALKTHLSDCSGTDSSLKPRVSELLNSLNSLNNLTPKEGKACPTQTT
jgi:hypothetical protein